MINYDNNSITKIFDYFLAEYKIPLGFNIFIL